MICCVYKQLTLEQHGGMECLPHAVKYEYNFCFQEALAVPQYPWFQDPPQIPKPTDAPVAYIKWHVSAHTFGPLHPQTPSYGSKTVQVFY